MGERPEWDETFIGVCREFARRATCDRLRTAALLVRNTQVLAYGYNGAVRGQPHCDQAGHLMVDGHCSRAVHAELNAILNAAAVGQSTEGATLYCLGSPCWRCAQAIVQAGVVRVVSARHYRPDAAVDELFRDSSVFFEVVGAD